MSADSFDLIPEIDRADSAGTARTHVNPTVAALMRRGFDSELANRVRRIGLTLADLKQNDDEYLALLGLNPAQIAAVRNGARPDIPLDILVEVLWANRSACCVCRAFDRAIIVHHITPWATSHDHSATNLAVLCLEHHAQAHRTGSLEQNLGERQLRAFKRRWEEEVRWLDPKAILDATRVDGHHWWWFNHVRMLEMARALHVDLTSMGWFASVYSRGWVDAHGQITHEHLEAPYLYVGGNGILLYDYMRQVAETSFARTTIFSLSGDQELKILQRIIQPGDLVLIQGRHRFRSLNNNRSGPGQACEVQYQADRVSLSFTIDRWEAVTTSSWGEWLSGEKLAASVVRIVSIEQERECVVLRGTGLAIGSALQGLSTRRYFATSLETEPSRQAATPSD